MASVPSQWIEEVTAHAQSDSLEDVREICADGPYFPNNLHICIFRVNPPTPLLKNAGCAPALKYYEITVHIFIQ